MISLAYLRTIDTVYCANCETYRDEDDQHCPNCEVRCEACLNYFNRDTLHPNIQTATYFLKFCCDSCLREEINELNKPTSILK
jgi:hypothetical protein